VSKEVQNCQPIITWWYATKAVKTNSAYTKVQDQELLSNKVGGHTEYSGRDKDVRKSFAKSLWSLLLEPLQCTADAEVE